MFYKFRTQIKRSIFPLAAALLLSGCGGGADAGDELVILEQEDDREYTLGVVTVEDVVLNKELRCVYQQVNDEAIAFQIDGRIISEVYVEEGSPVHKGQLLAELFSDNLDSEIAELEYQIARYEMLVRQAEENEEMDIKLIDHRYGQAEDTAENRTAWEDAVAAAKQGYSLQKEEYQDEITVKTMRLEKLQKERKKCCVYAGMDGTVSYVKEGLKGSYSTDGDTVIRVIDDSKCFFVCEQTDYMDYFEEGTVIPMVISSGKGAGTYELAAYQRSEWQDEMYFVFAGEQADLDVGSSGQLQLVLAEARQVLAVPIDAVHEADGKAYVYVLGRNQIRETLWIGVGLYGNKFVEVTSGLQEGDKVILK